MSFNNGNERRKLNAKWEHLRVQYREAGMSKEAIQAMYEFDLATLPVQTTIVKGEEAEIRCQLVRSGEYQDTKYFIRYFQPTGKGELRMEDGTVLLPNDLYPLPEETFKLYYKSLDTDQQKIDIYILDSFGQVVQKSFAFNNEEEDEKEDTE